MKSDPKASVTLPLLLRGLRRLPLPHKLGICERLFGRKIAVHGVCWVETATHAVWKLDLENATHRWIVYGQYEGGAFLDWARTFLLPDAVVVDSGANIGQMLLYLAEFVPRGRVLAFEPCKEAADWLEECLQIHPEFSVELLRLALGDTNGSGFLMSAGPPSIHGAWNQVSEAGGDPIVIGRLDDVVEERGIKRVDLWKLDVEGHELSALRGADSLIRRRAVRAIYVELGYDHGPQIVEYLATLGYQCFLFDRTGRLRRPRALPAHINGLFLPQPPISGTE
ncbi:MAG TPA: FkbM family methyltransferase [Thermoanaerobaculaceae bacterium]|nr:FkbM family methyltransferase [Thermoanaerobaculaceae bacterium]